MPKDNKKHKRRKKEEKEPKVNLKEKVTEILELPKEIVLDVPKITIIGATNLVLENYKGIIEYSEGCVRVNTSIGIVRITGRRLSIKEITSEDIMVDGDLEAFEFLK